MICFEIKYDINLHVVPQIGKKCVRTIHTVRMYDCRVAHEASNLPCVHLSDIVLMYQLHSRMTSILNFVSKNLQTVMLGIARASIRPNGVDGGPRHSPTTAHPLALAPNHSKKRKKKLSYPF
jgi:hypothetical protein